MNINSSWKSYRTQAGYVPFLALASPYIIQPALPAEMQQRIADNFMHLHCKTNDIHSEKQEDVFPSQSTQTREKKKVCTPGKYSDNWTQPTHDTLWSPRSKKSRCLLFTGISHLIPKQHHQPPMMLQPGVQQRGDAVVLVPNWQQPAQRTLLISPRVQQAAEHHRANSVLMWTH